MSVILSPPVHSAGVQLELVVVFPLDLLNVSSHLPYKSKHYMTIPLSQPGLGPHGMRIYET